MLNQSSGIVEEIRRSHNTWLRSAGRMDEKAFYRNFDKDGGFNQCDLISHKIRLELKYTGNGGCAHVDGADLV